MKAKELEHPNPAVPWYMWCKKCGVEKRAHRDPEFGWYYKCPQCGSESYPSGLGVL